MTKTAPKIPRRQQILDALAKMLEDSPGERITTSALAKSVGVSEAALYRHFPSKTKMFEGLIESIEETIFSQITVILAGEKSSIIRCEKIVYLLLSFAEENPGLSRLLIGDVLTGETERLRQRIVHFFDQIESQLKLLFSDIYTQENTPPLASITHLLMSYIEGCITQFVRSKFQRLPTTYWVAQWRCIAPCLI